MTEITLSSRPKNDLPCFLGFLYLNVENHYFDKKYIQ